MPNPLVLLPNAVSQPRSQVIYGEVSAAQPAPASFTEPLYVTRPGWAPGYFWAVTDWPACHGATLPAQGAECVLLLDTAGNLRCVWWDGAYVAPSNATTINGTAVPLTGSAWITPTLLNSWVNYGAPYETAGYLKDPLGFVHLKGLVKSGTSGTTVLTLPVGFRPGAYCQFAVAGPGPSFSLADIQSNTGNVTLFNTNTNGVGMAGITFLAEN